MLLNKSKLSCSVEVVQEMQQVLIVKKTTKPLLIVKSRSFEFLLKHGLCV